MLAAHALGTSLSLAGLSCRGSSRLHKNLARTRQQSRPVFASADLSPAPLAVEKRPKDHRKCVGIVLLNAKNEAFVACRSDLTVAQKGDDGILSGISPWQMPQGGVDKDEENEPAARRELREETNVTSVELLGKVPGWLCYQFPPDLLAHWVSQGKGWKGKYRGQAQKWFVYRFTGDESEIDLGAHGEPEFSQWRWMPLEEVAGQVVPFKRPVYERVVEYVRGSLLLK